MKNLKYLAGYVFFLTLFIKGMSVYASSQEQALPQSKLDITLSFAPVVDLAAPAVVEIYALQVVENPFIDDAFSQFFFGFGVTRNQIERSLGSGVIVKSNGVVITNYHVVKNGKQIKIKLSDHREFDAEIIAKDIKNDLAALKLKDVKDTLPCLVIGDSNAQKIGDLVLAIGNSFGLGNTVTDGIISALNRNVGGRVLTQTNAAVNPGNSGGALVNMKGELIGVPTAILSRTGTSNGVGFAIPSALVIAVINSIDNGGKVIRPWDGVVVQTVTPDIANSLGLSKPQGVIVKALHPSSPAKESGLKVSDVITAVNDRKIMDSGGYAYEVASTPIGNKVTLQVQRSDKPINLTFTPIVPPENPPAEKTTLLKHTGLGGVIVANLSPAVASEYGFDPLGEGTVIISIPSDNPLLVLGVQQGDVIDTVNDHKIKAVEDLTGILDHPLKHVTIVLKRGNKTMSVSIERSKNH